MTVGVAAAVAFGTARDLAFHLILLDLLLLGVAAWLSGRRRAHAILAAAGGAKNSCA